ncbi:MAG: carotenoid oxygenase family protein [Pseudomonadota bacterium]
MTQPFPKHPFLQGNYAPIRCESEAPSLVVEGELPHGLHGTLYRNGPNPLFPPRDHYHYFSGDGMIHAATFADGRVSYRNKWVRTEKWLADKAAGEALFGSMGNPMTSDKRAQGVRYNVANTHIVQHAGRLLALEEGNPPFELDQSLESIGSYTYDGALPGPMTAHPKVDPETGEMHFFCYSLGGMGSPAMGYYVADESGVLTTVEQFEAPYAAMVHDFVITENYVLFPIFPATIDIARAMKGGAPIAWDRDFPSYIGVLKRGRPASEIRWVSGEPSYVFHPMNAFEEDGKIILDMHNYPAAPGFPSVDGSKPKRTNAEAVLERWTIAPADISDTWTREQLDDRPTEFPRVADSVVARPYRHGYAATSVYGTAARTTYDSIVHYDLQTGSSKIWSLSPGDCVSEPAFVPKTKESQEGDGWLVGFIYRAETNTSAIAVLDANAIDAGPIATVQMDTRVPNGFHGTWVDAR